MNAKIATPETEPKRKLVLLPVTVGAGFDYLVPEGEAIPDGAYVEVPFGKSMACGIVWGEAKTDLPLEKLKTIGQVLDIPPLSEETRRFIDWVASYTLTPPGLVLKMLLGGKLRGAKPKDTFTAPPYNPAQSAPTLSADQQKAANAIKEAVTAHTFSTLLLDGVTGSGKTEVYAEGVAEALTRGHQVLILLPEIAMTAALFARLEARFGAAPLLWHSELSEKQRRITWNAIAQGEARLVIGARSALFLPFPDLGLIVVDEEHEAAYKQEDGVLYHGRDMAIVRAHLEKFPIVLASATPSLETLQNVRLGKYQHLKLPSRFGAASMPTLELVDLRKETMPAQSFISEPLLKGLQDTIAAGHQAMLFLNRRGYAPLTLCRACGHRLKCPDCTSWLIEHKKTGRLHCHHCGYSIRKPKLCPSCGAEDKLAACGPGIERIAEEVAKRLPEARAAIMASDTLSGPKAAADLIAQMENRELDLLIGTQIMAKGYHFPRLTFVGVIDADLGLAGGDPRAAERTFQLLQQMAGRSGRAEDAGTVLLQTTATEHPVMQALVQGKRDAFFRAELKERQAYRLPPFGRLASLVISGEDAGAVITAANKLAAAAPRAKNLQLLGPAPAPFALLRGRTRYRLLLQSSDTAPLSSTVAAWLKAVPLPRSIRVQVDIDPYSFL